MKFCTACGAEYGDEILFCQRDGTPLRGSEATRDLVGQVVAERYHIQKKLGEGGMGQVYLAEHVKMGRRCAIKIMAPSMMNDADAISRFNREAANASRITHPNVCGIYDFGETREGLIYLAMEYVEGHSLSGLLDETGPMSLPRAAGIIAQCADALQAAHELGIVHRDLKPDNIMVITSRGRDTVKVVDFGIAKATDAKASGQKVTKTGLVVGTPEYMSPEQLSGDPTDGRSDMYSLALVFYRVITGRLPFEADTAQETMIKRLTDEPTPLAVARPDLKFPPAVQRVLDRSLGRSPADRYASAGEFGREVMAAAGTMTKADLEAGTQVVKPEDMKKALSTVPATRVDPHVPRPSQEKKTVVAGATDRRTDGPTDGAGGAGPTVRRSDGPTTKRSPMVPIAAAAVLLIGGGSAFVMRDKLFGGGQVAAVPTDSVKADTAGQRDTSASNGGRVNPTPTDRDTITRPPRQGSTRIVPTGGNGGSTQTNPPKPPPVDLAAMAKQVHDFAEDFEFTDDSVKRAQGKKLGQDAWNTPNLNQKSRAEAAFVVSQAFIKEAQREQAKTWLERAYSLDPRQVWKDILDGMN